MASRARPRPPQGTEEGPAHHLQACLFFAIGWNTCHTCTGHTCAAWYDDTWVTVYWPELKATCGEGAPDDIVTIYGDPPIRPSPSANPDYTPRGVSPHDERSIA